MVDVNFEGWRIRNRNRKNHIDWENVSSTKYKNRDLWYGIFNGKTSRIQVPGLSAVSPPLLMINMTFYPDKSPDGFKDNRYQTLLSNCHTSALQWMETDVLPNDIPSVAIVLDTTDKQITFLGHTDDASTKPALFTLPYTVCKCTV
jgi:hypothetical protein